MTRIRALEAGGRNSHIPQPEADRRLDPSCCLTANLTDARRNSGEEAYHQRGSAKVSRRKASRARPWPARAFADQADDMAGRHGGVHACLISTM